MNNKATIPLSIYYALILLQFILPFIAVGIDMLSNNPELKLLDKTLYIEPQVWEISVMLIVGIILMIIVIGLLMQKEWARKTYLYTFIPSFFVYFMPYMQWSYMTSYAALFNDFAYICSGALLLILMIPQLYQPLFNSQKK